jgi:hypothetical protein
MILTGAGTANAAVTTTHSATAASDPIFPFCNQYQHHNQFQRNQLQERWNLSGSNTAAVKFEVNTYNYPVYLRQQGSCLSGTLTDPDASFTGQIHGTVSGNFVVFSVTYPSGSPQGTRTFNGTINRWGHVSGSWSETGSENAAGSWSLASAAQPTCQRYFPLNPNQGCFGHP